jgi:hypothetical protein
MSYHVITIFELASTHRADLLRDAARDFLAHEAVLAVDSHSRPVDRLPHSIKAALSQWSRLRRDAAGATCRRYLPDLATLSSAMCPADARSEPTCRSACSGYLYFRMFAHSDSL